MRLGIKRRLLAVTFLAVLALAQVIPASAGSVNLDSSFCDGYGWTNVVQPYHAEGGAVINAGACHSYSALYVYDPGTGNYVGPVDDDWQVGQTYVYYAGDWFAAQTYHYIHDNTFYEGDDGWSSDF